MELCSLTIYELYCMLKKGEVSSREIVLSVIERIERIEKRINAFVAIFKKEALEDGERADKLIKEGRHDFLTGIPLAIKDLICTNGIKTTCSSRMLANYIPPYDATVIRKLKEKGYVMIGKTNMDEFAMGSSTETSFFGPTYNPWNLSCVPGGSSGGSAAAVASDMTIAALGSDTGGSIRQPASLCGIVGLKPTYSRVSRFGLIAFASSLDQIGPMTKDVRDCAILLSAISGHDPMDSTSLNMGVPDYLASLRDGIEGLRIGIPEENFSAGIDKEVEAKVREGIKILEDLGAEIIEISLPHTEYALPAYYLIAPAEASSNLARYDGVKYGYRSKNSSNLLAMYENTRGEGFGPEVKRRIMLGTYALSAGYYDAYYKKASEIRTLIRKDYEKAFSQCEVIVTPTSPTPAFKIGEKIDDPLVMYLSDIFTIPANLSGIPALSLPWGYNKEGLPIGIQILAKPLDEETLLRVAFNLESNSPFPRRKPNLSSM